MRKIQTSQPHGLWLVTGMALLAWLLFGETLPATGIIGAALLILSVYLLA